MSGAAAELSRARACLRVSLCRHGGKNSLLDAVLHLLYLFWRSHVGNLVLRFRSSGSGNSVSCGARATSHPCFSALRCSGIVIAIKGFDDDKAATGAFCLIAAFFWMANFGFGNERVNLNSEG